jgi:hypothetical protein
VEPPRAPVITKVIGGDRQITIQWAANREPDLAEYRIYRALAGEELSDIRWIQLLHTEVVSNVDPAQRSSIYSFLDNAVPGQTTVYYRIIASDLRGNSSTPSSPTAARAYDLAPPIPVDILDAAWIEVEAEAGIEATWNPVNDVDVQLLRKPEGAARWIAASKWVSGAAGLLRDASAEPWLSHNLTLRTRSRSGNMSDSLAALHIERLSN